jgi:CheY-like chemotaxis protein
MLNRTWLARILVVVAIPFLLCLYLFPVAVQGKMPADRDNVCFYYPLLSIFQWDGIPTWNPYELAGSSLVANPQAALFYPPNWVLPFLPRGLGFRLTTLMHYVWAGLGAYFLARRLRLGMASSFMAAVTLMLGGYLQSRILLRPLLLSAAWMPWALALFLGALERERVFEAVLAGVSTAMTFFPGMYHNGVYTLLLLLTAAFFFPIPKRKGRGVFVLRRAGLLAIAAGMGVGLASVSIVPAAELLPQTVRSHFDYAAASTSSLSVGDLPRTFLGFPRGTGMAEWNFFEKNSFPGWAGLLLSVIGLFRLARRKGILHRGAKQTVLLFGLLFVAGLLVSLGENSPVHRLLFELPGGRFLNNPSRGLVLCSFSLAFLAGVGLEEIDQFVCRWRRPRHIVVYGLLIAQVGCFFWYRCILNVSFAFPPYHLRAPHVEFLAKSRDEGVRIMTYDPLRVVSGDFWPYHWPRFRNMLIPKLPTIDRLEDIAGYEPLYIERYGEAIRSLAGEAPGGLKWRDVVPREPCPRMLNLLSVGYVLGEVHDRLVFSEKLVLKGIESGEFQVDPEIGLCRGIRIHATMQGTLHFPRGTKVATLSVNGEDLNGKRTSITLPLRAGIEVADMLAGTVSNCAHPQIEVYRRQVVETPDGSLVVQSYEARIAFPESLIPEVIQLAHWNSDGVFELRAVVLEQEVEDSPFERVFEDGAYRVYRNPAPLPRAWLVFQADVMSWPEGILARLGSPDWDPRVSVLLEEPAVAEGISGGTGELTWNRRRADAAELEVNVTRKAVLVLSEVFYPGWKAWIDEERAPILQANGFLRAVVVPPGKHRIRFAYTPDGLLLGLLVVVICLGILAMLTMLLWWSRRKEVATLSGGTRSEKGRKQMGRTVLVVEDEADTRLVLTESLRYYGFEVSTAKDGIEAMESLEKSRPDVILLDMNLPVLSGWEALQMIKADQRLKGIPVVAVTASTSVSDEARALRLGCVDFIPKPFEAKDVAARIERVLERQRKI